MKRPFLLFAALILGISLKAQCPISTAVDFTATDVHGEEVHLFDILDRGQYVLIDFFFTTCGPCQQATPKVVQSYYAMGCNTHDVFYIEISDRDTEAACLNWANNYGVEYPTISGVQGGSTIDAQYQIGAYPTVILIAPDRSILIHDLWPISNAQSVISALEAQGVEPHNCNSSTQVSINIDLITDTEITATFTPNEDCASFAYMIATESEIQEGINSTDLDLPHYLWTYGTLGSETLSNTFEGLIPHTEYMLLSVPADSNGNLGEVVQEIVTTTMNDYYDLTLTFNTDTLWVSLDNNATPLFIYNNTAEAVIHLNKITLDSDMDWFYFIYDNQVFSLNEELNIPIAFRDSIQIDIMMNIANKEMVYSILSFENDLETVSLVTAFDWTESAQENSASSLNLFPNPANESVTLEGDNLGTVCVYNTLGQKMDEFETKDTTLNINTSHYKNGIYLLKTNNKTFRFTVNHQ